MNRPTRRSRPLRTLVAVLAALATLALVEPDPAGADAVVDPLAAWRTALGQAETEAADVVVIGDSITHGWGAATRSEWWLETVRQDLQQRWGGTGRGYRPAVGSLWSTDDSGWTIAGGRVDTRRGLGLWAHVLDAPEAELRTVITESQVEVRYAVGPAGGLLEVEVDGAVLAEVDTRAAVGGGGRSWTSPALGAGPHEVRLRPAGLTAGQEVVVEGLREPQDRGVEVWSAGHGGQTTSHLLQDRAWEESLGAAEPDLVLIELGSNDQADGLTGAQLEENLTTLVGRVRAAAAGPVSVGLVPVWNGANRSAPRHQELVAAQRRVADAQGLALIDLSGHDPTLLTVDGIHPGLAGQRVLASAVLDAIDPQYVAPALPELVGGVTLANAPVPGQVRAGWVAPSGADRFVARLVEAKSGKTVAEQVTTTAGAAFSDVLPGTELVVLVFAGNDAGFTTPVPSSSITTPGTRPTVPAAPTQVRAVQTGGRVDVTWASGGGVTEHRVLLYDVTTGAVPTARSTTAASISYSGLVPGRTYAFAVYSRNAVGWSAGAASNHLPVVATPAAPAGVRAIQTAAGAVTVGWEAPTSADAHRVLIYDVTTGAVPTARDVTGPSASFSGLVAGRTYVFAVYSRNAAGWSAGAASNQVVVAAVPARPTSVRAVVAGTRSVAVSWTASSGATEHRVLVYDVTTGAVPTARDVTATSVTYDGLVPGRTYAFAVYSRSAAGWSSGAASNHVTVPA